MSCCAKGGEEGGKRWIATSERAIGVITRGGFVACLILRRSLLSGLEP
jgi:hypothetical protein